MKNTEYDFFCGIDISKKTLDFCFIKSEGTKICALRVSNDKKGIKQAFKEARKEGIALKKTLFCCENTGIYTLTLANFLTEIKLKLWVENAVEIKKSQGLTRGKNDLIDAKRIAQYAIRFKDRCQFWSPKGDVLSKMKYLFSLRDRLAKSINSLKVPLKESKGFIDKKFQNQLENAVLKALKSLKEDLKQVEKDLEALIEEDPNINKNYQLVQSVPCVGKRSAMYLLLCTDNFSKITTYRQGACYAGIAPFEHSSGTSIRGKTRVSSMGNKYLKKLFHLCTLSILKHKKGELYDFYQRKIKEGKHVMSVLNALRNKLLSRIFACVMNGVKYSPDYLNSMQLA